ncbi:MAG: TIGR02186 family protein [Amaricoccus sp.]
MLRLAALLFLAFAPALPLAAQEAVIPGISTDSISLTTRYTGSQLFVFGAVWRTEPLPKGNPLDIVITVKGPPKGVTVRRKERRFGIWVNAESVRVRQVPSFYAVATNRPLDAILGETERLRYGIGMDQAVRQVGGSLEDAAPFTAALVRLREENGAFAQLDGQVAIAQETLFQTRVDMPANLVEGDYLAEFFLVRDGEVISSAHTTVRVEKTGIERWLYNLSRHDPLAYGLMSVALALAAGWLAAAAASLVRR